MYEIINPFFSTAYPFSACIWVENQEEAPKVPGNVNFPLMKQIPEFTRTVVLNNNFNISSVFPRNALFHDKGFTKLRYSVSGKREATRLSCLMTEIQTHGRLRIKFLSCSIQNNSKPLRYKGTRALTSHWKSCICPEYQSNIVLHKDLCFPSSREQKEISESQKSPCNRIVTLPSAAQGTDFQSQKVGHLMPSPFIVMKHLRAWFSGSLSCFRKSPSQQ